MSLEDEAVSDPSGLPDGEAGGQDEINERIAVVFATGGSSALVFNLNILSVLRTEEDRSAYLNAVAMAMTPDRIDPKLWERWLGGGPGPYERSAPKRPTTHGQSISRDLQRQSQTVTRADYDVTKAKESLQRAQERVDLAEAALVKAKADDQATLQSAVYKALRSEMEPMFAMGPAWAIMRALSGAVPSDEMADELRFERNEQKRSELEARVRKERRAETAQIMSVLYAWVGDYAFERSLRDAILDVVKNYEKLAAPRSSQDMQSFKRAGVVPGEAAWDRGEVLDGFS
ncbi:MULTISPECIES: hypothetical protein [Sphingomonas]|uniref:Uncharacterized protein n=1 Tax=Sphingomonas molluscorum TaxID=418184 RepID=A0ABU8Q4P2_9SPHN|nr:hypothetical protein [Sphingomonas sp. JUb134]MBM7406236.1 uncharacterized protein (DUF305 family) [Sphingomonas sp. JUb134]